MLARLDPRRTVAALRDALYPQLAGIANRWHEAMGLAGGRLSIERKFEASARHQVPAPPRSRHLESERGFTRRVALPFVVRTRL